MRPVVIVVVLPFAKLVIEQVDIVGELVEALSGACDALEELDVQLQAMPGLGLLVALLGSSRFTPLISR